MGREGRKGPRRRRPELLPTDTDQRTLKARVNYVVEKAAYVLAALVGLEMIWLTYSLVGPMAIVVLAASFLFLLLLKVGFLWLIR